MRAIRIAVAIAALLLIPAAAAHGSGGLISGWGYNAYGEIGNGTEAGNGEDQRAVLIPTPVPGLSGVAVAAEALDIVGHEAKPAVRKFEVG